MLRRLTCLSLASVAALVACASVAAAQHSVAVAGVADSIRSETCRGGTLNATGTVCRGATAATRVTALRRFANRLDSLERVSVPDTVFRVDTVYLPAPPDTTGAPNDSTPATVVVGFDYTTTVSWPGGQVGTFTTTAPELLCATVDVGGVSHLGDRAVVASVAAPDSVAFTASTLASEATLRTACGRKLPGFPASTARLWSVVWTSERVRVADVPVAVPVAHAVKP